MSLQRGALKNRLLAALPEDDLDKILGALSAVNLRQKQVIFDVGDPIKDVYFLEGGLASFLTIMANGTTIEVGMIGIEGLVGIAALLGAKTSAQQIIVQAPGTALRMSAAKFKELFDQSESVRGIVLRFIESFMNFSAQTAACNRLHSVEQRCSRWFLIASDRLQSDMLPMTHEFLSALLGVRRSGVTLVAGDLQHSGLIRYHHGQVTILDHEGLKAAACECYQADHDRFSLLL